MNQHRSFPRIGAGPLVAAFLLVIALIGGTMTASPAHAAVSNWQKIHVVNHPTSVTIDFVATRTYGPVFVIIGTGLDPSTSQVAKVTLPKQPNGTKYTVTIGGLKQNTGYSFRLATPLIAAFTDITMIVTTAQPLVFTHVVARADDVTGIISFDYPGTGPVTVTLSTTLDFQWYRHVAVLNAPAYGQRWAAVIPDLRANTGFLFKIEAANTPTHYDVTSIVTAKRKVVVKYSHVKVINDGDAWPYGCGDFALTHREVNSAPNANHDRTMDAALCLNDGDTWSAAGVSTLATGTYDDVKDGNFRAWFYAWDDDRTLYTGECDGVTFTGFVCGDLGWGETYLDITHAGTVPFAVHVSGAAYGNNVDVWAYGTVTTSFS